MRVLMSAFCLSCVSTVGNAATVELNFSDIQILPNSLGLDGGFPDENYTVSAESDEFLDEDLGRLATINRISTGQTGIDTSVQRLTVSRSDGGNFNLEAFDISSVYTGVGTEYLLNDEDGSFFVLDNVPTIYDLVHLDAVNRIGEAISASVIPTDVQDVLANPFSNTFPGKRIEASDLGADFTDLVSLSFSTGVGFLADELQTACLPQNLVRANAFFALYQPCGLLETDLDVRIRSGDVFGPRNDAAYYQLGSLTVSDSVAPVPLPGALGLLGAGLLFLGGLNRKSRKTVACQN